MTIEQFNGYDTIYRFEVVDKIPEGYGIWNILPLEGYEEYVPLIELATSPCYCVNITNMKAVKTESAYQARLLTHLKHYTGKNNYKEVVKYLRRKNLRPCNRLAEAALPILEKLTF